ncbi:MAG: hypothetical protein K2O06_01805 [Acetatifactor sp.]|nr:hypothetical protein [Acetatifactor sp.]
MIGTIHNSEVYELLGFHKVTTEGEKESWEAFTKALKSVAGDVRRRTQMDKVMYNVEDVAEDFSIPLNEKRLLSLEEFCEYAGGIGICTERVRH